MRPLEPFVLQSQFLLRWYKTASYAVVLKLFSESIILIQMKIQSINKLNFDKKSPENLLKYLHINFQIWFPEYNFKTPKYIRNIEVCSLRTPGLGYSILGTGTA